MTAPKSLPCPGFEDFETADHPLVVRLRDTFEALIKLQRDLLSYAGELDAMPSTGLIGPAAVAARIRAFLVDHTPTEKR